MHGGHFVIKFSISVSNCNVLCKCLFTTQSTIVSLEENKLNIKLSFSIFKGYFLYNRLVILSQTRENGLQCMSLTKFHKCNSILRVSYCRPGWPANLINWHLF